MKSRVNRLTYKQEMNLVPQDYKGKSLVVSLGGDGCFLRSSCMLTDPDIPILGVNTDPGRSLGILCGKFLYKNSNQAKHVEKIFS